MRSLKYYTVCYDVSLPRSHGGHLCLCSLAMTPFLRAGALRERNLRDQAYILKSLCFPFTGLRHCPWKVVTVLNTWTEAVTVTYNHKRCLQLRKLGPWKQSILQVVTSALHVRICIVIRCVLSSTSGDKTSPISVRLLNPGPSIEVLWDLAGVAAAVTVLMGAVQHRGDQLFASLNEESEPPQKKGMTQRLPPLPF